MYWLHLLFYVFFLQIQQPPQTTLTATPFPYPTLFRSTPRTLAKASQKGHMPRHVQRHLLAPLAPRHPPLGQGARHDRAGARHRRIARHHRARAAHARPWQARDRKSTLCTPVTNAHLVCRLLLETKKKKTEQSTSPI